MSPDLDSRGPDDTHNTDELGLCRFSRVLVFSKVVRMVDTHSEGTAETRGIKIQKAKSSRSVLTTESVPEDHEFRYGW